MSQNTMSVAQILGKLQRISYVLTTAIYNIICSDIKMLAKNLSIGFTPFMHRYALPEGLSAYEKEQILRFYIRRHANERISVRYSKTDVRNEPAIVVLTYRMWHDNAIRFRRNGQFGIYILLALSTQTPKIYKSIDVFVREAQALEDPLKTIVVYFYDIDKFVIPEHLGSVTKYMSCSEAWKIRQIPFNQAQLLNDVHPTIQLKHFVAFGQYVGLIQKSYHTYITLLQPDRQEVFGWEIDDKRRNDTRFHIPYFDDNNARKWRQTVKEGLFEFDPELRPEQDDDSMIEALEEIIRYDTDSELESAVYHAQQEVYNPNRDFRILRVLDVAKMIHLNMELLAELPALEDIDNPTIEQIAEAIINKYNNDYSIVLDYQGLDDGYTRPGK